MSSSVKRAVLKSAGLSPLAVIPASIPVALWLGIRDASLSHDSVWQGVSTHLQGMLVLNLFAVPAAYILMVVVGLPAAFLSLAVGRRSLAAALILGALVGCGFALVVKRGVDEMAALAMMIWMGVAVAGVFWLLFRRFTRVARHDLGAAA